MTGRIEIEVCLDAGSTGQVGIDSAVALVGGAATIELCRSMAEGGLTPASEQILAARNAFSRPGLMVMIRPRAGDFAYSPAELDLMRRQIELVARAGADGVVLGCLTAAGDRLAVKPLRHLVALSQDLGLKTTCHRAFDALADPLAAVSLLIDLGFDRLLTSGTPWGSGRSAVDGLPLLEKIAGRAAGRLELIIGGGVTLQNAPLLRPFLARCAGPVAVHAFSGVQVDGRPDPERITALCQAVRD